MYLFGEKLAIGWMVSNFPRRMNSLIFWDSAATQWLQAVLLLVVYTLMAGEARVAPKGFLATLTLIKCLLGVNSQVLVEMRTEAKSFATHVTGVRLLTSVNSLVLC